MKLEGNLHEIELIPHLLELADQHFTGAIRFENDGIIKILYFKEGDVLSASTNDRADSVDEILLRAGKVNRDHIREALGKRKDNETLGDALLSMGFISRKELTWGRRTQIVGILRSVSNWTGGSFQVVHDYLPNREEGTLFFLPQVILELAVTDPDKGRVEQRIESGAAVYRKRPGFSETYAKLALNEDADAIVEKVDGVRSAAEVAAVSNLDVFAVYKLLLALESLRLLERDEPQVTHEVLSVAAMGAPLAGFGTSLGEVEPEVRPVARPSIEPGLGSLTESWSEPDLNAKASDDAPLPEPDEIHPGAMPLPRPPAPRAARRSRSALPAVLGVMLLLAILGAAGWWWWQRQDSAAEPAATATQPRDSRPRPGPTTREVPAAPLPAAVADASTATTTGTTETVVPPAAAVPAPAVRQPAPPTQRAVTTPPAAASDPARARYQRMAEKFAREGAGVAYSIQFELVCQTESVARALASGSDVWFVPVQYRGQPCFRVFWGRYETSAAAESAKSEIPAGLRGSGPVVVRPRELLR
jgi:septal ring-binding cell division protein DamX